MKPIKEKGKRADFNLLFKSESREVGLFFLRRTETEPLVAREERDF